MRGWQCEARHSGCTVPAAELRPSPGSWRRSHLKPAIEVVDFNRASRAAFVGDLVNKSARGTGAR